MPRMFFCDTLKHAGLEADVTVIKADMTAIKDRTKSMETKVAAIDGRIKLLEKTTSEVKALLVELNKRKVSTK